MFIISAIYLICKQLQSGKCCEVNIHFDLWNFSSEFFPYKLSAFCPSVLVQSNPLPLKRCYKNIIKSKRQRMGVMISVSACYQ